MAPLVHRSQLERREAPEPDFTPQVGFFGALPAAFRQENLLASFFDGEEELAPETTGVKIDIFDKDAATISFSSQARCSAALSDDLHATQRVYEQVARGVPFRDAYREVARDCRKDGED